MSLKKLEENQGYSLIMVLIFMLVLAFMGNSLVSLFATSNKMSVGQWELDSAFEGAHAGLEYGYAQIFAGNSAAVSAPGKSIGNSNFTITEAATTLTSVGTFRSAQVTLQADKPKQKDCLYLDIANADVVNNQLRHIQMSKVCLPQIAMDKFQISWIPDNGERLTTLRIEDDRLYDDPVGVLSGTILDVADYVMLHNNVNNYNDIDFNGSMVGKTFTIKIFMADGSETNGATFTPP